VTVTRKRSHAARAICFALCTAGLLATEFAMAVAGHAQNATPALSRHFNIQHTVRYTELSHERLKGFWR